MEFSWELESMYKSVNSEKFKHDLDKLKIETDNLNKWAMDNLKVHVNETEKIEYYIISKNKLIDLCTVSIYVNLALSTDTLNSDLINASEKIENIKSNFSIHESLFINFLKGTDDLENIINNSHILSEHKFIINELKKEAEHTLLSSEEEIISKLKNTGSNSWRKLWEQITSSLTAELEIDGKTQVCPLSVIRNYAYNDSSEIRKKAYEAELSAYKKIELAGSFCINSIKGEVIAISNLKGYKSPLLMTLENSRIDLEILNIMFDSIKKNLVPMQKYFIKKAQILGHDSKLPFYDLFAPLGENIIFTYEQAKDFIIEHFSAFSEKMGEFAKKAFDCRWIDVLPKKGKVGGAYCEAVHSIKQSRILTNFSGTFNDVITLAHELGHAYHDSCLYNETPLNSFYTMPIAETASTLCENIVTKSALKGASKLQSLLIFDNDISGMTQVIIDIYSRFLFEDEVFNKRKNSFLNSQELCEIMIDAQKKAYGNGLDEKYMNPYMWLCKPHYYDADFNYYNFPYAFGFLLSKGLYKIYTENTSDFRNLYDKMLSLTGKNNINDVVKLAGIDLYDENFWNGVLNIVISEINEFCEISF